MKITQPEPRRRSALLSRAVTPTNSAGVALSRSGPRKRAVRCRLPSLFRTTPAETSAAQGRKSARLCGFLRYSARFIMARLTIRDGLDNARAGALLRRRTDRALPPTLPPCGRMPTAQARQYRGEDRGPLQRI